MKHFLLILSLFAFLNAISQRTQRINAQLKTLFLDSLSSWNDLVRQAKKQDKFIYLYCASAGDCCTGNTYETEFFPKTVSAYLTNKFILLNLQVDYKTKNEFTYTKAASHFLDSLKKAQNISASSIHLIFDKNGKPLTRFLFSFPDSLFRITYLKNILKGNNQYYPLLSKFKKGNRRPEFIRNFYKAYQGAVITFNEDTIKIFREFISAYPGSKLFNKENGNLIYEYANWLYDVCSRNLFINKEKWYKVLGKKKVDEKIIEMLCRDFEFTVLLDNHSAVSKKSFEKAKEAYFVKQSEYKEYEDIVSSKSFEKRLSN
jgi:hypothetical protein